MLKYVIVSHARLLTISLLCCTVLLPWMLRDFPKVIRSRGLGTHSPLLRYHPKSCTILVLCLGYYWLYLHLFSKTSCKSNSFYNARLFNWGGGFRSLEISSGGSRVTLINAMKSSSMATAAVKTCEIIGREKVTAVLLVPPMLDFVMKNIPSKQLQQGAWLYIPRSYEALTR